MLICGGGIQSGGGEGGIGGQLKCTRMSLRMPIGVADMDKKLYVANIPLWDKARNGPPTPCRLHHHHPADCTMLSLCKSAVFGDRLHASWCCCVIARPKTAGLTSRCTSISSMSKLQTCTMRILIQFQAIGIKDRKHIHLPGVAPTRLVYVGAGYSHNGNPCM